MEGADPASQRPGPEPDTRVAWLVERAAGRVLAIGSGEDLESGLRDRPDMTVVRPEEGFAGMLKVPASDLPAASFDSVLLDEVLEHLTDPEALLSAVARSSKPEGTVALAAGLGLTSGHQTATFFPASLLELLAPALEVSSLEITETHLLAVGRPGKTAEERRLALLAAAQPRLETWILAAQVAGMRHAYRADRRNERIRRLRRRLRRQTARTRRARRNLRRIRAARPLRRARSALGRLRGSSHAATTNVSATPTEPPADELKAPAPEGTPRRADVTAGVILDRATADAFGREWRQVELDPHSWRAQLEAHPPDLLLAQVPATMEGSGWHLAPAGRADLDAVAEATAWCRTRGIPTALWSTGGPDGLEDALAAARLFDHVFTVDRDLVRRFREALGHERVAPLAPVADPLSMLAEARSGSGRPATPIDSGNLAAHRELRAALDADTCGHRVDEILSAVGIATDERRPAVSITLSTVRESQIPHVIEQAARQRWRPLQLVLVLHGLDLDPEAIAAQARRAGIDDAVVIAGERSWTLGACLNAALGRAEGELVQKMDDDDLYGVHFVGDLARAFSYTDATVVGKLAQFVHLERSGATMLRWPHAEHTYVRAVHGGTILVRADVLHELGWTDTTVPADTFLLRDVRNAGGRIYSADRFSFVYMRRGHTHGHVWTLSDAAVIRSSTPPVYGPPDPYLVG